MNHALSIAENLLQTQPGPDLLHVRGLKKTFGARTLFADVSFGLQAGTLVLLRGENGAGKTTLLNILSGVEACDGGTIRLPSVGQGHFEVRFPLRGREVTAFGRFSPWRFAQAGVSRGWQHVRLFRSLSLVENLGVGRWAVGSRLWQALFCRRAIATQAKVLAERARTLLARFGLHVDLSRPATQISLGQSKRVAIARAVESGASVLLFDEPCAGLDDDGVAQVFCYLRELVAQGAAVVVVEHDYHFARIRQHVDIVWTLAGGQLRVEDLAKAALQLASPSPASDPLENWLRANCRRRSVTQLPTGAVLEHWQPTAHLSGALFEEQPSAIALVVSGIVLERMGQPLHPLARKMLDFPAEIGNQVNEALVAQGQPIEFEVHEQDIAVLHAPNGWGKTTLLETLAGLLETRLGNIQLGAKDIAQLSTPQRAQEGLTILRASSLGFPSMRVSEFFRFAGVSTARRDVADLLTRFGRRLLQSLSGGERQRVLLQALFERHGARVRVLDEPFLGLDAAAVKSVLERLLSDASRRLPALILIPSTPTAATTIFP